ncbi:MAG: ATP-binding protein, partial [Candidatus Nanoarchaeia archaeon]|nr:ATP-binding protein [Candidatus Nanoarchaeia archaeon]
MKNPLVIIITGLQCSGKTTLGKNLSKELKIPFISKDDIKEILFDDLGWKDKEWSIKLGSASYDLLYYITEELLKVNNSLIIETNFYPKLAKKRLSILKDKYSFTPFQIKCFADGEVLFDRFKKRSESKLRHPGHIDGGRIEEWKPVLLRGKIETINIGGELLEIDTTDFEKINYK